MTRACFVSMQCDQCERTHYADEPCACLGAAALEERLAAALRRECALKDQIAVMLCNFGRPTIIVNAAPQ